jgi:hypothetical protein
MHTLEVSYRSPVLEICFDKNHSSSEERGSSKLYLKIHFPTSKKTKAQDIASSSPFKVIMTAVYSEDRTEKVTAFEDSLNMTGYRDHIYV